MDFISFISKMLAQDCDVTFRNDPSSPRGLEVRLTYFGGAERYGLIERFSQEELSDSALLARHLEKMDYEFGKYLEHNVKRPMPLPDLRVKGKWVN